MGNINLYKSSSASGPWNLVKSNISSPFTITENTGGSLYYAVRDEGNGSNIKPSNYKVISSPVYVFKSTDKINNITFDDTTDLNSLIVKITSTCGNTSNHKVQVQINIKNTGWKNFTRVAIGTNIQAKYTTASSDGVIEGSQIKFRAYIFNTTNANYKTNNSSEYTYTLQFTDAAPTINGALPINSKGYGNTSLSNKYSIFNTTGSVSYGKGSTARIPLTRNNIFAMFDSSSNINVSFGYKVTKIGTLSGLKTSSFTATNKLFNQLGISKVDTDGKASFPIPYAINGQEKTNADDLPTDKLASITKRTITIAGINFNYYGFGFTGEEFMCVESIFTIKPIQRSSTTASAITCFAGKAISYFGTCGYTSSIDTNYSVGRYFNKESFVWNKIDNVPDNENSISFINDGGESVFGNFLYKSFIIIT